MVKGVTGNALRFSCYHNRWTMDVQDLTIVVSARGRGIASTTLRRVFPGKTRILLLTETLAPSAEPLAPAGKGTAAHGRDIFARLNAFEGPPRSSAFMVGDSDYTHAAYGYISAPRRVVQQTNGATRKRRKIHYVTVTSKVLKMYLSNVVVRGDSGAFLLRNAHCTFKRRGPDVV